MQQRSLFDFARRPGECQSTVPSGPVGVSPPACVPPSKEREEPPTQRPRTEDYHPSPTTAPQSVDAHHHDEFTAAVEKRDPPTACSMATAFKEDVKWQISDAFQDIWPSKATDDRVPYAVIVDVLADISATSSRLECIKLLTRLFQAVAFRCPSELVATMYLVINKQGPPHEGIELGIGDSLLTKVVAECCGMTETRLKEEYKQMGDLAEIAQNNRQKQCTLMKPKPLYASGVFGALKEIAMMSGKDVMKRRADIIKRLLRDAQGAEVNFIIRALQQKMRIGLAEPSAVTALGYAFALNFVGAAYIRRSSPEHLQAALDIVSSSLARFHHEVPSIEVVVAAVLEHGPLLLVPGSTVATQQELTLRIRPGLPVKPQLAHPTSGINVILNRFEGHVFTSEYKYDGERAQIHYQRGRGYFIYSRNSETHTGKYPDVVSAFPSFFDDASVESFIIDSEIVAVNPETGALQAFQVLQHRGRKNISEKDVTIPVCVFAFDILFFNGEPQLSKSLSERREMLWSHFKPTHGKLAFATHLDTDNVEDIQRFLDQSIADGCEGLMVKTLHEDATYTPAKRSHYWLKLKKDYMDGVTDTLDLVPIAAFYGKGKRTGVFGGFLLACYDPETDEYQSICKIGTGFQDEVLEQLTRSLKPFAATEKPRYYRCEEEGPDVWLTESQVWEVKAADLSISPVHFAAIGQVDPSKGIALRFPRYIRTREDKKPVDSTSAQQVADMYRAQSLAIRQVEAESEED